MRSFAGPVVAAGQNSGQVPRVAAVLVPGTAPAVQLMLANDGNTEVVYTLTPNGYYDVIVTANTSDGCTRRYAGRIG